MSTHASFLLLFLLTTSSTTTTASAILSARQSGPIFLGRPCTPGSTTCLGGAQCYAVNSMLIPTCGSFGASCSSSAQCATNTCVNGACNGPVAPVLPLGSACYESAQCVNQAACYAVNAMQIPSCGNFQAQCVDDSQCAFNTCVDGFCNGAPLASSSSSVVVPTTSVSPTSVSSTSASPTVPTSTTSLPTTSSSGPSSSLSSSVIVPSTSVPTGGSTETVTTFTTTTSCPSVSTTVPPPTGTGHSSVIGNSTSTTTAQPSPTLFQGAGEQMRAGVGSIVVAAALAFALMIGA